jgi:hypothetical protein
MRWQVPCGAGPRSTCGARPQLPYATLPRRCSTLGRQRSSSPRRRKRNARDVSALARAGRAPGLLGAIGCNNWTPTPGKPRSRITQRGLSASVTPVASSASEAARVDLEQALQLWHVPAWSSATPCAPLPCSLSSSTMPGAANDTSAHHARGFNARAQSG